jgi:RHS repeat-associated protein
MEPASTTRFVWDGDVVVHEIEAAVDGKGLARTLVFRDGSFVPLADCVVASADDKRPVWRHYVTGPAGNPEALVDAAGNVIEEISATVWGGVTTDERTSTSLRFQGQYADDDAQLSYNRARFYDPEMATYISPDPLGLSATLRAYEYPRDPFTGIDPLGLIRYNRGDYSAGYSAGRSTCMARDSICQYCQGAPATSCDHVVSVKDADAAVGAGMMTKAEASAAVNNPENMLGTCGSCNSSKQDKPAGNKPGCWTPSNPTPRAVAKMEENGNLE